MEKKILLSQVNFSSPTMEYLTMAFIMPLKLTIWLTDLFVWSSLLEVSSSSSKERTVCGGGNYQYIRCGFWLIKSECVFKTGNPETCKGFLSVCQFPRLVFSLMLKFYQCTGWSHLFAVYRITGWGNAKYQEGGSLDYPWPQIIAMRREEKERKKWRGE